MKQYARTPTMFQKEAIECGAACLGMIMAYYGRTMPLEQLCIETATSRDSISAADLMRAARRFGLNCRGFQKQPEELKELNMPCIIHWNFNHFVVLEGFKGNSVWLNDPADGRRELTPDEFAQGFTGVVLTFEKTENCEIWERGAAMKQYARTPTMFQKEAIECGAACLGMIMAYYGRTMPLEQLRIEIAASPDSVSAADLMRAAKRLGLSCRGFRKEPEELKALNMPCIIHWNFNHFVVLEGFKGKSIWINDPAVGRRDLTPDEFARGFTGVVLTFEKTENFENREGAQL